MTSSVGWEASSPNGRQPGRSSSPNQASRAGATLAPTSKTTPRGGPRVAGGGYFFQCSFAGVVSTTSGAELVAHTAPGKTTHVDSKPIQVPTRPARDRP